MNEKLLEQGRKARDAARFLSTASTTLKNEALIAMARALKKVVMKSWRPMPLIWKTGKQGLTAALGIDCC